MHTVQKPAVFNKLWRTKCFTNSLHENLRQRMRSCEIVWKRFCEECTSFLIFYQGQENTVVNNHQTRRGIRHALTTFKMMKYSLDP